MADSERMTFLSRVRRLAAEVGGASDAALLDRFARDRDEAAFELLVWRHARLVYGVCRRVLSDVHDAEDAFQATFLALARRAGRIRRGEAVAGWLYQVAYRAALAARTRRARASTRERPLLPADDIAAPRLTDAAELNELKSAVDEEVSRLPARFRAPVVLCYLEGKSVDEAARQLGCPRGTVASRMARARTILRHRLTRRGLALTTALAAVTPTGAASRPLSLIPALVPAAVQLAAGRSAGMGAVSPQVASLTEEVLKAMFLHKLKTGTVALVALVGLLVIGGGLGIRLHANAVQTDTPVAAADDPPPQAEPNQDQAKAAEPAVAAKPVTVVHPVPREASPVAVFAGRLEAGHTFEVRATANGRLDTCRFRPGDTVKKGQSLFEIDPRPYQLSLLQATADLEAAKARRKQVAIALANAQKLQKAQTISQQEVEKAHYDELIAQAALKAEEAKVAAAQYNLDAAQIKAPGDGQISRPLVEPGNVVSAGDRPTLLAKITSLDPIAVQFDVDERSYLRYRRLPPDQAKEAAVLRMAVSGEDKFTLEGSFVGFDDRVDPSTNTVRGHGIFPNHNRLLLPGMWAQVRMTLGRPRKVLTIPGDAIRSNGPAYVWVVNDRNRVEPRRITVEWFDDDWLAVEQGITVNDRILVGNLPNVGPGDVVQPRRAEPAKDSKGKP